MELILNDKILEFLHSDAIAEGTDAKAGDKLRGGFRYGYHMPAVLGLELLKYPADKGGLPGGRPAGEHYSCDFLCHIFSPFPKHGNCAGGC